MDPNQNLDATSVFGVQKPRTNAEELFHRELERRSLDIIRVKNPDSKDYYVEWDKRFHRVPANGTADIPRYIAIKYCKDKAVETINLLNEKMHDAEIEDREKKGLPPFESKWHEQQATYTKSNYPKTGDRELLAKLYGEYWVGLVYEFGKDQPMQTASEPEGLDMTPIELKIIKDLENRRVDVADGTVAPIKEEPKIRFTEPTPVAKPKEVTVDEVTIENEEPNTPTEA